MEWNVSRQRLGQILQEHYGFTDAEVSLALRTVLEDRQFACFGYTVLSNCLIAVALAAGKDGCHEKH